MRLLHFAATGLCVAVAFGGACGSNEETGETPAATPASSLGPVESLSPTPVATQDFGPSTATIELAAESKNAITVDGRYILDLQQEELYRTGGHVSFSPDSRLATVSECCATPGGLAVIDLGNGRRQEIARGYVAFVDWLPNGRYIQFSLAGGHGICD